MSDDDIDNMDFALPQELTKPMDPFAHFQQPQIPQFQPHQEALLQETKTWTCVYPVYIDKSRSLDKGRRVPLDIAVEEPAAVYMAESCGRLGLKAGLEANKRHPKDPLVFGRLRVQLKNENGDYIHPFIRSKKQLLVEIAKILEEVKSSLPDADGKMKAFADQSRSVIVWPDVPMSPHVPIPKQIKPIKKKK